MDEATVRLARVLHGEQLFTVLDGDNLASLPLIPEHAIDAVITDPPYGLSAITPQDVQDALTCWLKGVPYVPTKVGFMSAEWDGFVPGPETWREVYRTLKPGGHALVFAGSRTVDLMGLSLRLAGFELRDGILAYTYSSGFHRALDASQAIDRELDVFDQRQKTGEVLRRKPPAIGYAGSQKVKMGSSSMHEVTSSASDEAKTWEGWYTGLKPTYEPILVARRPVAGNVAQNILKYGVGALNIDANRIGPAELVTPNMVAQHHPKCTETDCAPECITRTLLAQGCTSQFIPVFPFEPPFLHSPKAPGDERDAGLQYDAETALENEHPTAKPVKIMQWLCRLVTPPNGVILDPFAGSGSTGVAARIESFRFIGMELSRSHAAVSRTRIAHALGPLMAEYDE